MIWAVVSPLQPFCSAQMGQVSSKLPVQRISQKGLSALKQLVAWEGLVGSEVTHLMKVTLCAASP